MAFEFPPNLIRPVASFGASRIFTRPPQFGKFYAYSWLFEPLASGALPGASGSSQTVTVDANVAFFEGYRLAAFADNYGVMATLKITPAQEVLNDLPLFLSLFGSGRRPTQLVPPWRFGKNAVVTVALEDRQLVAAADNVRLAVFGQKVYDRPLVPATVYNQKKPAIYTANFTNFNNSTDFTLTANQGRIFPLRVDGDSDFEIQKLAVVSDGPVVIQIRSDSDNWFDQDIRSELLGGSTIESPFLAAPFVSAGDWPLFLAAPRLITGASYISVTATDRSGAANRCQVMFIGERMYPSGGLYATPGRS